MRTVLLGSVMAASLMPALANAAEWRATFTTISGNASTCTASSANKWWIIEENNTLVVANSTKRTRHLTIKLQPDGSAAGDFSLELQRIEQVRVKVPAGSGPRVFEFLTLANACTVRVDPAQ